ncbi:S9 family peptidase [Sporosarcina thermotolerans]|uniref:S9 family peptidase n=1 Tax=Sporosarcina thermotolerans TaxID=633404 RepID=A0AAW9AA18_9BACL|nr:S9 family peptidase [Sporosarcina thermotolerans]MDW0117884.1 S9 family peptidase [Sporosarcina thermotolerans]WHT49314.1 S9 family peptidase [Sporosarcina thermotolerans]
MKPPIAKRIPHPHELHGDVREDDYYWLNERDNPEVIQYLEEENKYFEEIMRPLEDETNRIYQSMVDRVPDSEVNVPVQHGQFFYYSRLDKSKQYPIYARKEAASRDLLNEAQEQVVLDLNELAVEDGYLSVTALRFSSDQTLLAYLENRDGTDRCTIHIKNLETGELLPDRIPNVYLFGSMEWSRSGEYIFYTTVDEHQRPYRLWRHRLGTEVDQDELVYEEVDTTFTLFISKSQSQKFIFVHSHSKTTNETRMIDTDSPLSSLQLLDARRPGVLYDVEHWGDELLILTNENALNFKLLRCSLDDLSARTTVIEHSEARYLQAMYPFRDSLLVAGRENGLTQIWVLKDGKLEQIKWDEPLYTVAVLSNQSYEATEVLIQYESLLTPKTTYSLDLITGEKKCLQVAPVSGDYDRSRFRQEQLWATADDGVKVPMTAVYFEGALDNGPAPLILYGYGSYGSNSDPRFDPYRLPILERGVVFITAQVRGGSEMGRGWYEDGKMQKKRNTFTDFIAAAKHLIENNYTTPSKMAARGGSAGGLLVGAVANMAGELFEVIVPAVPFVDVVTTMLDTTIPLTTLEWDEWGDPRKPEDYFYMKSYSPYDNVEAKDYPHLYITTGINDPRVGYFEPAKWVARLRLLKTDDNVIVMKTNMGAGHFGKSGRFNHLKEAAECYAFILDRLGVLAEEVVSNPR